MPHRRPRSRSTWNLKSFRGDSQFRTWVLSIARNEGLVGGCR